MQDPLQDPLRDPVAPVAGPVAPVAEPVAVYYSATTAGSRHIKLDRQLWSTRCGGARGVLGAAARRSARFSHRPEMGRSKRKLVKAGTAARGGDDARAKRRRGGDDDGGRSPRTTAPGLPTSSPSRGSPVGGGGQGQPAAGDAPLASPSTVYHDPHDPRNQLTPWIEHTGPSLSGQEEVVAGAGTVAVTGSAPDVGPSTAAEPQAQEQALTGARTAWDIFEYEQDVSRRMETLQELEAEAEIGRQFMQIGTRRQERFSSLLSTPSAGRGFASPARSFAAPAHSRVPPAQARGPTTARALPSPATQVAS